MFFINRETGQKTKLRAGDVIALYPPSDVVFFRKSRQKQSEENDDLFQGWKILLIKEKGDDVYEEEDDNVCIGFKTTTDFAQLAEMMATGNGWEIRKAEDFTIEAYEFIRNGFF